MSKPKKQHYIPQSYLREFVDPNTPSGQEPYVWIFNKGERKGRKKAPSNIFTETDLYTIKLKSGEKSYVIEETLSSVESKYAAVFREKIKQHLPLSPEEHILLCVFVAIMLRRTIRYKDNVERFFDELIQRTEMLERAHNAAPRTSLELKEEKENVHKRGVFDSLPKITQLLTEMSVAFLVAEKGAKFVTSDDPCNLFNPDLQWQRFYGPGLGQKNVQLTLPLSPQIMLCMSWSNFRGYMRWERARVQESNRMTVGYAYKYFISHSPKPKRMWFRPYPLDPLFIMKIIKHKFDMWQKYVLRS